MRALLSAFTRSADRLSDTQTRQVFFTRRLRGSWFRGFSQQGRKVPQLSRALADPRAPAAAGECGPAKPSGAGGTDALTSGRFLRDSP
ncbi:hypothetical protein NDU88_000226 [Pleurodeles waltl]|uniref:Uncharacterized protein n=1 Tax=Pleurodeles waltl TaxID=8319 RepID=A0AAV7LU03_PLEWA|nr:hypothetical protein NDU88_000226 [Pleurodeles waltl]